MNPARLERLRAVAQTVAQTGPISTRDYARVAKLELNHALYDLRCAEKLGLIRGIWRETATFWEEI
jgi:hypothetical protein